MQAYATSPSQVAYPSSYLDSGATHHVISDLSNLNMKVEECNGSEQIQMDNGNSLPVTHHGTTSLPTPQCFFLLHNVLHVSKIIKNIISIQKFTIATNTNYFEFHPHFFCKGLSYKDISTAWVE